MVSKEKFNKIISSHESFNIFLEEFKREIFLFIPEIVVKHIEDFHKLQKLNKEFYAANPELKNERFLIGSLANKISAENPGLSIEEVFELTALKAKKVLLEKKHENKT